MIYYQLHQGSSNKMMLTNCLNWVGKYWFQIVVTFFLAQIYLSNSRDAAGKPLNYAAIAAAQKISKGAIEEPTEFGVPSFADVEVALVEDRPQKVVNSKWKSSDFRNLSFVFDPKMAERKGVPEKIVEEKMKACRNYVNRFASTAIGEMKQFDIPASITLAQGLLETDAGGSKLASESNNHFGIKCRSKCRGCTCRNYSDDDVYDMFRVFDSAWESYREHSKLLSIDRYKSLKKLGRKNYEAWAAGLKKAGYATDKNYDKKLVQIIEELDLHQFDK